MVLLVGVLGYGPLSRNVAVKTAFKKNQVKIIVLDQMIYHLLRIFLSLIMGVRILNMNDIGNPAGKMT